MCWFTDVQDSVVQNWSNDFWNTDLSLTWVWSGVFVTEKYTQYKICVLQYLAVSNCYSLQWLPNNATFPDTVSEYCSSIPALQQSRNRWKEMCFVGVGETGENQGACILSTDPEKLTCSVMFPFSPVLDYLHLDRFWWIISQVRKAYRPSNCYTNQHSSLKQY